MQSVLARMSWFCGSDLSVLFTSPVDLAAGMPLPVKIQAIHSIAVTIDTPQGCTTLSSNSGNSSNGNSSSTTATGPCLDLAINQAIWAGYTTEDAAAELDERLSGMLQEHQLTVPGQYTLFAFPHGDDQVNRVAASQPTIVGQHRHAWVTYGNNVSPEQLHRKLASASVNVLSNCYVLHTSTASEGTLPLSAASHAVLSFTLLNADPDTAAYSWDFDLFERRYLEPIQRVLSPVAHLSVESQVLYYTSARVNGLWSEAHDAYVLEPQQLPFFVDSEWALESGHASAAANSTRKSEQHASSDSAAAGDGMEPSKVDGKPAAHQTSPTMSSSAAEQAALLASHVLHVLLYISPVSQRPLRVLGPDGQPTQSNSFWIPSWGGVIIVNPDGAAGGVIGATAGDPGSEEKGCSASGVDLPGMRVLNASMHQHIAGAFVSQLHALFGLPNTKHWTSTSSSSSTGGSQDSSSQQPGSSKAEVKADLVLLPASDVGFTAWEVEALLRQRTASDVLGAARVLKSLSTLVQELPNLEMPDVIGEQVSMDKTNVV